MAERTAALAETDASRPTRGATLDAESAERLAALGYIGRVTSDGSRQEHGSNIDPKDCIEHYNEIVRARGASSLPPSEPVHNALCQ